jgi:hypothetical protein
VLLLEGFSTTSSNSRSLLPLGFERYRTSHVFPVHFLCSDNEHRFGCASQLVFARRSSGLNQIVTIGVENPDPGDVFSRDEKGVPLP